MKKVIFALLFLFLLTGCKEKVISDHKELNIIVTSDIHYFFKDYYKDCEWFEDSIAYGDGKMVTYADEILDAFVKRVKELKPELVIITGDLSFNGEKLSHQQLSTILKGMEEEGVHVAVLPGNHDIDNIFAKGYGKDDYIDVDIVDAKGFEDIYRDLGFDIASDRHKKSLSYSVELNDRYTFVAIDTNSHLLTTNSQLDSGGKLTDSTYQWVEKTLKNIASKGKIPIVAMHHNLAVHNSMLNQNYTIRENEKISSLFQQYGVKFVLTGHIHCQSIKEHNGIYDIASESLVNAPLQFGLISLDEHSMTYKTQKLDLDIHPNEYFDMVSSNKLGESFRELKDQNKAQAMIDVIVKANRYYFSGVMNKHIEELKQMKGYTYLMEDESKDLSFSRSYLESMMEDPNDDTSLVIQY